MRYFPKLSELVTQTVTAADFFLYIIDIFMLWWIFLLFGLEHSLKKNLINEKGLMSILWLIWQESICIGILYVEGSHEYIFIT